MYRYDSRNKIHLMHSHSSLAIAIIFYLQKITEQTS